MKRIKKGNRLLALVLSVLLAASGLPAVAFAEGQTAQDLCEHHLTHTADCGYAKAQPCEHKVNGGGADREGPLGGKHTEDCYTAELICNHDEAAEITATDSEAEHTHVQDCYALDCPHDNGEHDDACGYAKAQPCTYTCQEPHGNSATSEPVNNSLSRQERGMLGDSQPQYEIALSPDNFEFAPANEGYTVGKGEGEVKPWDVNVYNHGSEHEDSLSATLEGDNKNDFALSNSGSITWLEDEDASHYLSITIAPMPNLTAGTYSATLKVKGDLTPEVTATVSFTVNPASPGFVAVTNIKDVPTSMTAGTPLALTGTVEPNNATNNTIVWNVVNAGSTGASLNGNTLSATSAGQVTVKATIANGAAASTPFVQTFSITVNPASPGFVAVTNIKDVPTSMTAGTPLALTGTVEPHNATNNTIVWNVVNAGSTGASLNGNTLSATSAGQVTVKATIANGAAAGAYEQSFLIQVSGGGSGNNDGDDDDSGGSFSPPIGTITTNTVGTTVSVQQVTPDGKFQAVGDDSIRVSSIFDANGKLLNPIISTEGQALVVRQTNERPDQDTIKKALGEKKWGIMDVLDIVKKSYLYDYEKEVTGPNKEITIPNKEITITIPEKEITVTIPEKEYSIPKRTSPGQDADPAGEQETQPPQQTEQAAKEELSQSVQDLAKQAGELDVNTGLTPDFLQSKLKDATVEELQQLQKNLADMVALAKAEQERTYGQANHQSKLTEDNGMLKKEREKELREELKKAQEDQWGRLVRVDESDSSGQGQSGSEGEHESGQTEQKPTAILIKDERITPVSDFSILHKVNGAWQEELAFPGNGFVIITGVNSFSPFALVADPSTLAIPDLPVVCTFQPKNAGIQDGVLRTEVSGSGVQTAIDLARKLAEQTGTAHNGVAVTIDLTGQTAASSGCSLTLSQDACQKLEQAGVRRLDVETRQFSLSLDTQALQAVYAVKGDVTLRADKAESLSETAGAALGARPAYSLSAENGGKAVSIFGQGTVTLSLPYAPQGSEQRGSLTLAYVNADGTALPLAESAYNAADQAVSGHADQAGVYGIAVVPAPAFGDVGGHWAVDDIAFAASRGYLNGTGNGSFSPDAALTRGMLMTVFHRLAGSPQAAGEGRAFSDVPGDAYCADAIRWAAEAGMLNKEAAAFYPEEPVTREELAALLQSYAWAMGLDLPRSRKAAEFADSGDIAGWTRDAVRNMQMAGVLNGSQDNRFDPTGTVTRAEFAAVLRRFTDITIKQ